MSKLPDIDIDFADNKAAMAAIGAVPAMVLKDGKRTGHPSGAYMQDIPIDPVTNLAAFDYKEAEHHGFSKIDLLNQSIYRDVRDEAHLIDLMTSEPPWDLLDEEFFVEQLAHVGKHFGVVQAISPRSVEDLAIVLALIRPAKRHLIGKPMDEIRQEIWLQHEGDEAGYAFKKAHAISYASLIVVQMNLISEKLLAPEEEVDDLFTT